MTQSTIYRDISKRTGGALYIGVIGPVRSGKSTFIKRFMESMVLPQIQDDHVRERTIDELPQSAAGKTIMTTEPKFVPEHPVSVHLDNSMDVDVRLVDCVGYVVPSAMGYIEDNAPRMVKTPWYEEEIPFNMAAEIGTSKVITDHSTIGIVVTTDGSITDIPREEYAQTERRVISELKALGKPFAVLLNSVSPQSDACVTLCKEMENEYNVPVCPVDCLALDEKAIAKILAKVLAEFPVCEVDVSLPRWITSLDRKHPVRQSVMDHIKQCAVSAQKLSRISQFASDLSNSEYILHADIDSILPGEGKACVRVDMDRALYYRLLSETTGLDIADDASLMDIIVELAKSKTEYDKIRHALDEVEATGYGIVMPTVEEMELDEPEIIKQSGRYGIRLRAQAPSIHMMKATINTEVSPIVGSERQSEELVAYLLREFEENPSKIWESNIFGTSLYGLVNEGLHNKLCRMPTDARMKMKETVERVINEGCNGLICIIV